MLEINFIYQGKNKIIQSEETKNVKETFEEFANQNKLKIRNLVFFHNNIKVNLNTGLLLQTQFDLEDSIQIGKNNQKRLEILVFNKVLKKNKLKKIIDEEEKAEAFRKIKIIEINFKYKNTSCIIKCDLNDSLKRICEEFSDKNFLEIQYLIFIYNGAQVDITKEGSICKQLNLEIGKIKANKKIEILVFEEFFQIIFSFCKLTIPPLTVKESILVKEIVQQFIDETKEPKENLTFVYNAKIIRDPSQKDPNESDIEEPNLEENNIWEQSLKEIISEMDRSDKLVSIMVYENNDDTSFIARSKSLVNPGEILIEEIINVKFFHQPKNIIIEAKKDDKLIDIFHSFATSAKISEQDLSNILFIYERKRKKFSMDDANEKTLVKIASKSDISAKEIIFIPTKKIYDEPFLDDDNKMFDNDLNEYLLDRKELLIQDFYQKKKYFLRLFFILAIQYSSTLIISTLCFIFRVNKIFAKEFIYISIMVIFITFLCFSFIMNEISKKSKSIKKLIYFIIFYPIIISYISIVMNSFLEYKYILIGLSLIILEKLSQGIYVFIFKKYKLLFLGISSTVLSLIGLLLFSILWLKDLLPIIYVSIFWLLTIGINALLIFISLKLCDYDEYYYSIVIFNFGIFLYFAYNLKKFFIYVRNNFNEINQEKSQIKIFLIFLVQYILIIVTIWIVLETKNMSIKDSTFGKNLFHELFWPPTGLNLIIFLVFSFFYFLEDTDTDYKGFIICHVLYVPIMILYYLAFSYVIEGKYILCFTFIIFLDLLAIIILFLFFKTEKLRYIFIACFVVDTIAILLFHFFWLNNTSAIIAFPILSIGIIIYLIIGSYLTKTDYFEEKFQMKVVLIDYGLFFLTFVIVGTVCMAICYILTYCCENH